MGMRKFLLIALAFGFTAAKAQPLKLMLQKKQSSGAAAQNLLKYSEELDNTAVWSGTQTVTANTTTAPDATTTAETIDVSGDYNSWYQSLTVTASTQYTFSFYALAGTATSVYYSVYSISAGSDIVTRTNYAGSINSSTWTRISVTFTTPAGTTSIAVYPSRSLTERGTTKVWGAQLNIGATAGTYTKTTSSAIP